MLGGASAYHREVHRALVAAGMAIALTACGSSAQPTATSSSPTAAPTGSTPATPFPTAAPSPTSTPSPTADTEQVTVTASGVGAHYLQAIPVAVLHNQATSHTATEVVAHFTVHHPGGTFALDAAPVALAPGETLAVAALCTDSCQGATSTEVNVGVGGWSPGPAPAVLTAAGGTYACGSPCGGGGGYTGAVTGTLSGALGAGTLVNLFVACSDGAGAIVGGGVTQRLWPGGGAAVNVSVPVLVSSLPASCQLYGAAAE